MRNTNRNARGALCLTTLDFVPDVEERVRRLLDDYKPKCIDALPDLYDTFFRGESPPKEFEPVPDVCFGAIYLDKTSEIPVEGWSLAYNIKQAFPPWDYVLMAAFFRALGQSVMVFNTVGCAVAEVSNLFIALSMYGLWCADVLGKPFDSFPFEKIMALRMLHLQNPDIERNGCAAQWAPRWICEANSDHPFQAAF